MGCIHTTVDDASFTLERQNSPLFPDFFCQNSLTTGGCSPIGHTERVSYRVSVTRWFSRILAQSSLTVFDIAKTFGNLNSLNLLNRQIWFKIRSESFLKSYCSKLLLAISPKKLPVKNRCSTALTKLKTLTFADEVWDSRVGDPRPIG